MSQLSQLISLVSNLTNRLNQIESGSKRIFELPETTPNGLSKIPLSRTIVGGEVSEYITMNAMLQYFIQEIQNIEDSTKVIQMLPPELLSGPRRIKIPVVDSEEEDYPIMWKISGIPYSENTEQIFNIPDAEEDHYRKDLILATASGIFRFAGSESTEGIIEPSQPENTVLLTSIVVFGDSSYENPTTPILGSQYIKKESEKWRNVHIPGTKLVTYLNENSRKLNIISAPNDGVLEGFHNNGGNVSQIWDGSSLYVKNDTLEPRKLRHMSSEPNVSVKFFFQNNQIYSLPPKSIAHFLFNFTEMIYEFVGVESAKNIFFDNTGTDLDSEEVEGAIKELRGLDLNDFTNDTLNRYIRLDETLVKLEENMTFTVGVGKDFETISEAIDQALNYYPNADYKITILIDESFEINENISYQGLDFSHIIIKTTGIITVNPTLTGQVFRFDNCWLPIFDEFDINGHTSVSHLFVFITSFASLISNSEISGFQTSILYNGVFSARIENTIIEVPAVNSSYGINAQNSYVRTDGNTQIVSLNTANLNITTYAVLSNTGSIFGMSGTVLGNFRRALYAQNATILSGTQTLEATQHHLFVERGATIINRNTGTLTSNVPLNTFSGKGLILNENKPNPIDFDGTDYILDYIKAPSGQEYNVTVDDTGKLISEPKPVIPDVGVMLPLYFIDVVLNKTQINNLNTTPVTISTSDFGLEADEAVKLVPSKMEIFTSHDGTPLSQTGNIVLSVDIFNVVTIPSLYYINNSDVIFAGFNFTTPAPLIHENWSVQSTSEITGGGTDATIKIRLFYEKIKI